MPDSVWGLLAVTMAQAIPSEPLSGGAGWIGAGLLGGVLSWLMFVHLPAKDKQLREMLQMYSDEREKDRVSRHAAANMFQIAIVELTKEHRDDIVKLQADHLRDAERDREAFMQRSAALTQVMEARIVALEKLIRDGACRFDKED